MKKLEEMVVERLKPASLSENLIIRETVKVVGLEVVKLFKEHMTSLLRIVNSPEYRDPVIDVKSLRDALDKFNP